MVSDTFVFEGFEIRLSRRQLLLNGRPARIGSRAFDLLVALVENRERVVAKDELMEILWPGVCVEENTLQVHMSALRKVIGSHMVVTVPGRGYRLCAEASPDIAEGGYSGLRDSGTAPGNVAAALPQIFGREREVSQLCQLARNRRVLTLIGGAGIGKSRLAQAVAWELRNHWPDGVWFVELAPARDPADVPFVVMRTLDMPFPTQGDPIVKTADKLQPCRMLLVLDNCEHVIEAVTNLVTALFSRAPGVHLMLTSQVPLRIAEEQRFSVDPLALPSSSHAVEARKSGALALLEARIQMIDPFFRISDRDMATAVEICQRLDGLPLAIELAAGRVPLLGIQGVCHRLNDCFRLLSASGNNRLPRHRTLQTALEWSYSLLGEPEKAVLRRLGIFQGGFSLASAKTVACDDQLDHWAVLDCLTSLVDRSMVVVEAGSPPRYRLLETTRFWSIQKLNEADEFAATTQRHALAMAQEFEFSEAQKWSLTINDRLNHYRREVDNLKMALEWAASPAGEPEFLIALVGASAWLFRSLGYRPLALKWCEKAIACVSASTPPAMEARVLVSWVGLRFPRIDADVLSAIARAVGLLRGCSDPEALVAALADYAACLAMRKDLVLARQVIDEAYDRSVAIEPKTARLKVIRADFWLHLKEDRLREGCKLLDEGVMLARALGDTYAAVWGLVRWAYFAYHLGEADEAVRIGREAVSLVRDENFHGKIRWYAMGTLTFALAQNGQSDEAIAHGREILSMHGNTHRLLEFLDVIALVALRSGRPAEAAQALGCADVGFALRGEARRFPEDQIPGMLKYDLGRLLTPAQLEHHLREGVILTPKQAASQALGLDCDRSPSQEINAEPESPEDSATNSSTSCR